MLTKTKNAFKGQITQMFIGIMVLVIIAVAVCIPVIAEVSSNAGLTGTTKLLVDLIPLFVAISVILIVVSIF